MKNMVSILSKLKWDDKQPSNKQATQRRYFCAWNYFSAIAKKKKKF